MARSPIHRFFAIGSYCMLCGEHLVDADPWCITCHRAELTAINQMIRWIEGDKLSDRALTWVCDALARRAR